MGDLEISIITPRVEYEINVSSRVCVITGDSGVGKTIFYDILTSNKVVRNSQITVEIDGNVLDRRKVIKLDNMISAYERFAWQSNSIIDDTVLYLVDDDDYEQHELALYLLSKTLNAKFIFITRNKAISSLNYDVRSVYKFKLQDNGKKHTIYRVIDKISHSIFKEMDESRKLIIISEDSKAGYQFYNKLCKHDVVHITDRNGNTSGNSCLIECLESLHLTNEIVVLFIDWCSYGFDVERLAEFADRHEDVSLVFNEDIASFEHLLLTTNLLISRMTDKSLIDIKVDRTLSYEKQYQCILAELTRDTDFYVSHHSNLPVCYYAPCCSKYKDKYCRYILNGEKFEALFKNTVFSYLLEFRRL